MSVQYADDASKWALRQFWWSVSVATLVKRSPPNCCAPNSPKNRIGPLGPLHRSGRDRSPVSTRASKGLGPTESRETSVATSVQAKVGGVGGVGGVDLPPCGWTSLATLRTSDLRADTALPFGAPGYDPSHNLEALKWGQRACFTSKT